MPIVLVKLKLIYNKIKTIASKYNSSTAFSTAQSPLKIETISKLSSINKAILISTFDFLTLYTNIQAKYPILQSESDDGIVDQLLFL